MQLKQVRQKVHDKILGKVFVVMIRCPLAGVVPLDNLAPLDPHSSELKDHILDAISREDGGYATSR